MASIDPRLVFIRAQRFLDPGFWRRLRRRSPQPAARTAQPAGRVGLAYTLVTCTLVTCTLVTGILTGCRPVHRPVQVAAGGEAAASASLHPVHIAPAPAPLGVQVASPAGPVQVPCGTCHRSRPAREVRSSETLTEFHQDLVYAHGELACTACHDPEGYEALRLADGTRVEYGDPMPLCRQCHGTQARDYDHGAHGGWAGYWDLQRGPRTRNQCVHCHDPHAPAFPHMQPTFKPRDRFLDGAPGKERP